jgi:hypothetical protein
LTDETESGTRVEHERGERDEPDEGSGADGSPARHPRPVLEARSIPSALAVAAMASIAAGAIHATAVGAHGEHRATQIAFMLVAVFQIGWGALALTRSQSWVALLGAAGNAAALGGWVLAKTSGIGFIDGLEAAEGPEFADTVAAALAAVAVLGALAGLIGRLNWARQPQPVVLGVSVLATLALVVPGMVSAGSHGHAGGHGDEHGDDHEMSGMDHDHGGGQEATAIPPEPYDGTLPVDFSGVPGVTPEQQAEAEELATRTIQRLPQFADTQTAYDRGYRSIGDSLTGVEHYMNWSLVDDGKILDPDYPESLVYRVDGEQRTLVAAMFMLSSQDTLETTPDIGGPLIQWHIHDNLCFAGEDGAWTVADVAPPSEECRPGTFRLGDNNAPMIHVWVTGHPCGPFAALEGIGGGQIREGEARACDHQHGDPSADVGEGPPRRGPPEAAQGS